MYILTDTHHTHYQILSVALVVLKRDIPIVIDHQTLKPVGATFNPALRRSARCQRCLRCVGDVLPDDERCGP